METPAPLTVATLPLDVPLLQLLAMMVTRVPRMVAIPLLDARLLQ